MSRNEITDQYTIDINEVEGMSNIAVLRNTHPNTDDIIIAKGELNYKELVAAIGFNAANLAKDNTSTLITHQRILTLRTLLDKLENYNDQLQDLEW